LPEPALNSEPYALAVITDDAELFRDVRKLLAPKFRTTLASSEDDIKSVLELPDLNAILFDLDCVGDGPADGLEVLAEIRKLREDTVLFTFTRSNNRTLPLKAAQAGADEFFFSPLIFGELHVILSRFIEKRALEIEGRRLLQQVESKTAFHGLVGGSLAMEKVYQAIEAVASTGASVVLRGESGVGKELVARAIVQCSDRADRPFICLNCSALPETLMESELFGYEKGAFTGADGAKPGMVELAHTGTLFLDEITTLHPSLQSKLLRVLQEHSVRRLGGRSTRKIDFRLITATNDDLEDVVRKGLFHDDRPGDHQRRIRWLAHRRGCGLRLHRYGRGRVRQAAIRRPVVAATCREERRTQPNRDPTVSHASSVLLPAQPIPEFRVQP